MVQLQSHPLTRDPVYRTVETYLYFYKKKLSILEDLKIVWNMDVHYSVDIKLD